jgi:hypothetical protein
VTRRTDGIFDWIQNQRGLVDFPEQRSLRWLETEIPKLGGL